MVSKMVEMRMTLIAWRETEREGVGEAEREKGKKRENKLAQDHHACSLFYASLCQAVLAAVRE